MKERVHSNISIQRPDFLDGLSRDSSDGLFSEVKEMQAAVLHELDTRYKNELSENHKPKWYDFHKKRHLKKVQMAKELQQACLTEIKNEEGIAGFLSLINGLKDQNLAIDSKGGKFNKILTFYEDQLRELGDKLNRIIGVKETINEHESEILYHLFGSEAERRMTDVSKKETVDRTMDKKQKAANLLRSNYTYHQSKVLQLIEILTNKYGALSANEQSDELVLNTADGEKEVDQQATVIIEEELNHHYKNLTDELMDDSQIFDQDKGATLDKVFVLHLSYLKEKIELDIYRHKTTLRGVTADFSLSDQVRFFLLRAIMREFSKYAIVREKLLLWGSILDNYNEESFYFSLKERKKGWYRDIYQEELSNADPMNTGSFTKNLLSLISPVSRNNLSIDIREISDLDFAKLIDLKKLKELEESSSFQSIDRNELGALINRDELFKLIMPIGDLISKKCLMKVINEARLDQLINEAKLRVLLNKHQEPGKAIPAEELAGLIKKGEFIESIIQLKLFGLIEEQRESHFRRNLKVKVKHHDDHKKVYLEKWRIVLRRMINDDLKLLIAHVSSLQQSYSSGAYLQKPMTEEDEGLIDLISFTEATITHMPQKFHSQFYSKEARACDTVGGEKGKEKEEKKSEEKREMKDEETKGKFRTIDLPSASTKKEGVSNLLRLSMFSIKSEAIVTDEVVSRMVLGTPN